MEIKPDRPGGADRVFGAAESEPEDALGSAPEVHGDEGGGDPAAGALQDSGHRAEEKRRRRRR